MTFSSLSFMSHWTQQAINNGVSEQMIVLVLMFPIIATIIAFIRQVIGLKTLGVYLPSILAITFLATGIKVGLIFFISILVLGTLIRFILVKFRLLYLPRIVLILTFVSLLTFIFIVLGAQYKIAPITEMAIFPMLVMIILVERFINAQIEKGWKTALFLTFETLIISIFCYFLMVSQSVQQFIFHYPEIILAVIIFNLLIGRWTGLRLIEYFRFRPIIKS